MEDTESDSESTSSDGLPGLGIGTALAGVGTAGYALERTVRDDDS